jgi:hypothetical protein
VRGVLDLGAEMGRRLGPVILQRIDPPAFGAGGPFGDAVPTVLRAPCEQVVAKGA